VLLEPLLPVPELDPLPPAPPLLDPPKLPELELVDPAVPLLLEPYDPELDAKPPLEDEPDPSSPAPPSSPGPPGKLLPAHAARETTSAPQAIARPTLERFIRLTSVLGRPSRSKG
jgi:hypothetical protein